MSLCPYCPDGKEWPVPVGSLTCGAEACKREHAMKFNGWPRLDPSWREPDFSAHNLPERPSYGRVSRPDPAFSVTGVSVIYRDG